MLIDELDATGYGINKYDKLMSTLGVLDEKYDNVLSIFTKRMLNNKVTIDDAKALLQSHEYRIECRRSI